MSSRAYYLITILLILAAFTFGSQQEGIHKPSKQNISADEPEAWLYVAPPKEGNFVRAFRRYPGGPEPMDSCWKDAKWVEMNNNRKYICIGYFATNK